MSSVVKYNRIIVQGEKRILSNGRAKRDTENNPAVIIASKEADRLIEKARKQSEVIVRKARDKAKRIEFEAQKNAADLGESAREEGLNKGYSEGYSDGYELGLKEGQTQGKKEYDNLIAEARKLKQEYSDDYEDIYKASEEEMVGLAIDIAKKIIGDALVEGDKTYAHLAYKALEHVRGKKKVELRTSSEDYSLALQNKDLLLSRLEGIEDIEILEDPFLERGDCVIDTGNGSIDGSVRTGMEKIERSLLELVETSL